MEFKFNLNDVFKSKISKINHTLIPSDFSGDGRSAQLCASQVASVVDAMGRESAKVQSLHHPVVSAGNMRDSDCLLYIMIDSDENNGRGSVVGILKIGMKNLFLFDGTGMMHEMKSLCVLDFYVHESKQRKGFGKKLFDYMLNDMEIEPCKLAFDKPPGKFLLFLHKHYGLAQMFPQNNNFVMFEGFFSNSNDKNQTQESLDDQSGSDRTEKDDRNCFDNHSVKSRGYIPNAFGRHTAYKLQDSMAGIIEQDLPPVSRDSQLQDYKNQTQESLDDQSVSDHTEKDYQNCFDNQSDISGGYTSNAFGRHTEYKLQDSKAGIVEQDLPPVSMDSQPQDIWNPTPRETRQLDMTQTHHTSLW